MLIRVFALLLLCPSLCFAIDPRYSVADSIPMPGEVRWDTLTVDPNTHHLYIAHGDRVDVLNVPNKKFVGSIANIVGAHGVAIAPDLKRGFASSGNTGSVVVFDVKTLRPINTIAVGDKPDAIIFDSNTHYVIVANGDSHDISVIDPVRSNVISTIALEGEPEFMVAASNTLYINLVDVAQIAVIDLLHLKVEKRFDLSPVCSEPTGLALDENRHRLFVSCRNNTMVIIASDNGERLAVVPIGAKTDGAAYDPILGLAFSSNGDGTLSIVRRTPDDRYTVTQTLNTMLGARTMAMDFKTHRIYLPTAIIEPNASQMSEPQTRRHQFKRNTFRVIVVAPIGIAVQHHSRQDK